MEVKDLMLGDWIEDGHKKAQATSITCDGIVETTAAISNIEVVGPIPLAEEILVKNGFEQKDYLTYVFGQVEIIKHRDNWNVVINKYCVFVDMNIKFIHQLQHLLRLCGIEKEIEL